MDTRKEPRARDLALIRTPGERPADKPRERPRLVDRSADASDELDLWDNVPV